MNNYMILKLNGSNKKVVEMILENLIANINYDVKIVKNKGGYNDTIEMYKELENSSSGELEFTIFNETDCFLGIKSKVMNSDYSTLSILANLIISVYLGFRKFNFINKEQIETIMKNEKGVIQTNHKNEYKYEFKNTIINLNKNVTENLFRSSKILFENNLNKELSYIVYYAIKSLAKSDFELVLNDSTRKLSPKTNRNIFENCEENFILRFCDENPLENSEKISNIVSEKIENLNVLSQDFYRYVSIDDITNEFILENESYAVEIAMSQIKDYLPNRCVFEVSPFLNTETISFMLRYDPQIFSEEDVLEFTKAINNSIDLVNTLSHNKKIVDEKEKNKKYILDMNKYVKNVYNETIISKYKPSNMQTYFLESRNFAQISTRIAAEFSIENIVKVLNKIIAEHSVLRTAFDGEYLIEYSKTKYWEIPVLKFEDSKHLDENINLLSQVCNDFEFDERKLLNTMFIASTKNELYIKCFIEHAIWDSISSEIFEKELINNLEIWREINEDKDIFSIEIELQKNNASLCEVYTPEFIERVEKQNIFTSLYDVNLSVYFVYSIINVPFNEIKVIDEFAFTFCNKILKNSLSLNNKEIGLNYVPNVLFHGRDENNKDKMGMYLKLIPISAESSDIETEFATKRKSLNNNITFAESEAMFEFLPETIGIPIYINYKNIFNIPINKEQKLANIQKFEIHSILQRNDTLGVEFMVMDQNIHLIFPTFTEDREEIENILEKSYGEFINDKYEI
ncbi:TPA: condensation domain-containing protein [Streptococcus agalactiae]|nr:hypothetical protein [Streptococcus agalactiae]